MPDDDRIGTVLNGTYRLEGVLGRGGLGTIYRASDTHSSRSYAVKVLRAGIVELPTLERLQRDLPAVGSLAEPHVAQVVDFHRAENGAPYTVTELLQGEDLRARLRRVGHLSLKETARIVDHVADALQAAHQHELTHGNLKASNIFLSQQDGFTDFVKVLDFGIPSAVLAEDADSNATALNSVAPEQAERRADVDGRADIFSLGAIAYECLTGKAAFRGGSPSAVLEQIRHGEPTPIREINPNVPEAVDRVLARALAKKPEDRYPTVGEMRDEFVRACGSRTLRHPPVATRKPAPETPASEVDTDDSAPPIRAGLRTSDLVSDVLWRPQRRFGTIAIALVSALAGAAAVFYVLQKLETEQHAAAPPSEQASAVPAEPGAAEAAKVVEPTARKVGATSAISATDAGPPTASAPAKGEPEADAASDAAPGPTGPTEPSPEVEPAAAEPAPTETPQVGEDGRTVRVQITSRPRRARVYRLDDNELLGKTPLELDLPHGKERVGFRVRLRGYRSQTAWVTPTKDRKARVRLRRRR